MLAKTPQPTDHDRGGLLRKTPDAAWAPVTG
jgi:hypothetical protein